MPPANEGSGGNPSMVDFEEKFLRLREEYHSVLKKNNEQEVIIRTMNTKLAQIENSLRAKQRLEMSGISIGSPTATPNVCYLKIFIIFPHVSS